MFDLVDGNADTELRLRELQQARTKLLSWDLNGDGRITRDERPANSQLVIQNGETTFIRWNQNQRAAQLSTASAMVGPQWFRHMDRNGDGDVSAREFLGPREAYFRFDVDSDGLISATEAERRE